MSPLFPLKICIRLRSYDREAYLAEIAREGAQLLLAKLFSLPTTSTADIGILAQLPKPTTPLPRAKPIPKPKPPTKWEKFAAAKGISKTIKDKKVWDDDKQDWVDRWGRGGKNKEKKDQWIHVLPDQAGEYSSTVLSNVPCPF
jgi:regulator of ribosome biosynthesis